MSEVLCHFRQWTMSDAGNLLIAIGAFAMVCNGGSSLLAGEHEAATNVEAMDHAGADRPVLKRLGHLAKAVFTSLVMSAHATALCIPPLLAIWCWFVVPCLRWWRMFRS